MSCRPTSCINSTEGNLLMEEEEVRERWEEYVEELNDDDRGGQNPQ